MQFTFDVAVPSKCPTCGSTDLAWDFVPHTSSGAPHNRLGLHDVSVMTSFGCNNCSATLYVNYVEKLVATIKPVQRRDAIVDIEVERERQVTQEGWTPEHDNQWRNGELGDAAAAYIFSAISGGPTSVPHADVFPDWWPFDSQWWKPTTPRRDLIKAAALLVAEIERLDRYERDVAALVTNVLGSLKGAPNDEATRAEIAYRVGDVLDGLAKGEPDAP